MSWIKEYIFHEIILFIFVLISFIVCLVSYIKKKGTKNLGFTVVLFICLISNIGLICYQSFDITKQDYEQYTGIYMHNYRKGHYYSLSFNTDEHRYTAANVLSSEHYDYDSLEAGEKYIFTRAKRTKVLISIEKFSNGNQLGDG